jgi:hypothetical protein
LIDIPQSEYKWILTSLSHQLTEDQLISKLKTTVPEFIDCAKFLSRNKNLFSSELPAICRTDYWLAMDSDQVQEYENILLQGRKRIIDLVKGGNPFLIQSNIFTLIHQIKQLSNFSSLKESSPKAELMIEQLEAIISMGQKSIIFSQYDKQGIQKIERHLKANNIHYVLCQAGMPIKELENSASSFKRDPKINVMLTGLTSANLKAKIPDAPYLIHFDQWWNPVVQWHFEDKMMNTEDFSKQSESVNVFNYFGQNSIEIKIRETLLRKGLMTKNLIEFLSNETIYSLITTEDWLDILEIEYNKSIITELPSLNQISSIVEKRSLEEIGQNIKTLFIKLGFKNLMLKPDANNKATTIFGMANKNLQEIKAAILCIPFNVKDPDSTIKSADELVKINNRVFIICSDELAAKFETAKPEKVSVIGLNMLANYLSLFKIQ